MKQCDNILALSAELGVHPHYVFLLLPEIIDVAYEKYREARGALLESYCAITKLDFPEAERIIGIATESGRTIMGSEDFLLFDASNWTNEDQAKALETKTTLIEAGLLGQRTRLEGVETDFPVTPPIARHSPIPPIMKGRHRNEPCPCGSGKKFKRCHGKAKDPFGSGIAESHCTGPVIGRHPIMLHSVLGLRWEHIDFVQKMIYVAHTKTGKPRRIPMSSPVEVKLRSLRQDASSDEHVFSYARTGLKLTTFRHAWEGACKQAKITGLRFHDLRHTFATRLRSKGVHEMDIMTLLGHTTLQMTSRYTHAMPQNLRNAVDSLNKEPLPFRPKAASAKSAPRSRQVATRTDGA